MATEPSRFGSAAILNDRAIQERIAVALEAQLGGQPVHSGVEAFSITYTFPDVDMGGGTKTERIEGVEGFRGTVKAILIYNVTETWSDTDSEIDIGINGGDTDAYVDGAEFGILLDDTDASLSALAASLNAGVVGTVIPVGEDIIVTFVTPTSGTTGIATVGVTIQYYR